MTTTTDGYVIDSTKKENSEKSAERTRLCERRLKWMGFCQTNWISTMTTMLMNKRITIYLSIQWKAGDEIRWLCMKWSCLDWKKCSATWNKTNRKMWLQRQKRTPRHNWMGNAHGMSENKRQRNKIRMSFGRLRNKKNTRRNCIALQRNEKNWRKVPSERKSKNGREKNLNRFSEK